MDLLTIQHEDFTMYVECTKFDAIWKAYIMDKLSTEQRHANMAAIRSKDTKPEMTVRHGLWRRGFRCKRHTPPFPCYILNKKT